MPARIAQQISKHFDEEIRFFRTWIDQPKAVGAVLPTSAATARKMASLIEPGSDDPILELGARNGGHHKSHSGTRCGAGESVQR